MLIYGVRKKETTEKKSSKVEKRLFVHPGPTTWRYRPSGGGATRPGRDGRTARGAEGGRCLVKRASQLARWSSCALYLGGRIQHRGYQVGQRGLAPVAAPEA